MTWLCATLVGNPVLAEMGLGEEAVGRNAIAAGFQDSASGLTTNPAATFRGDPQQ